MRTNEQELRQGYFRQRSYAGFFATFDFVRSGVIGFSCVFSFSHFRNSTTSSSTERPARQDSSRSYDLYNAELDVTREKRTQRHLGSMAATQVVCICPLMVLRLAKMVLTETYENARHFDFTYLMFVWTAFLPTVIFPCIYVCGILSR